MWLENLRDLRNRTGMSVKQIAEKEDLSEKSVSRVFSGESKNPGVDLVLKIIHALGGSKREIFAESGAVIGGQDLAALQAEVEKLTAENKQMSAEISALNSRVIALTSENASLRTNLEHKEEIIAVHNDYRKFIIGMTEAKRKGHGHD